MRKLLLVISLSALVAGCTNPYDPAQRAIGGGLLGAGAGAAIGGLAGGGPGAATGALIGGGLGALGGVATTPTPPPQPRAYYAPQPRYYAPPSNGYYGSSRSSYYRY